MGYLRLFIVSVVALMALVLAGSTSSAQGDISGDWQFVFTVEESVLVSPGSKINCEATLRQTGATITGSGGVCHALGQDIPTDFNGTLTGNQLQFKGLTSQPVQAEFTINATVSADGNSMTGDFSTNPDIGKGTFEAARVGGAPAAPQPQQPAQVPTTGGAPPETSSGAWLILLGLSISLAGLVLGSPAVLYLARKRGI